MLPIDVDGRLQVTAGASLLHRSRLLEWKPEDGRFAPVAHGSGFTQIRWRWHSSHYSPFRSFYTCTTAGGWTWLSAYCEATRPPACGITSVAQNSGSNRSRTGKANFLPCWQLWCCRSSSGRKVRHNQSR